MSHFSLLPSRLPLSGKLAISRKPKFLALFRMELRAGHAVSRRDDGSDRPAVVRLRDQIGARRLGIEAG